MKKIFIITSFLIISSFVNAQLKVDSLGSVSMCHDSLSNTKMLVGNIPAYLNEDNHKVIIGSNSYGSLLLYNDTTKYQQARVLQKNLFITNNSSSLSSFGLYSDVNGLGQGEIRAIATRAIGGKQAIGVYGAAMKSTSSYGKFSSGIVGRSSGALTLSNIVNGVYAGYFIGDVRVSGSIYGTVLSPSASSGGSGMNGEGGNCTEDITEEESSVTDKLQQVELIKMSRVNYDGSLAANKVVEKTGRTDNEATDGDELEEVDDEPIQTHLSAVSYGLAADQLKQVYPELVYEDKEGNYSINYIEMVPLLVQSIKELSAKVETLEQQLGMQKSAKKSKQQTSAVEKMKGTKSDKKSTTYDLSGRPATNPQRGVYVQDGKKVAIK